MYKFFIYLCKCICILFLSFFPNFHHCDRKRSPFKDMSPGKRHAGARRQPWAPESSRARGKR